MAEKLLLYRKMARKQMALVNDIATVKRYLAVNISFDIDTILPYITRAEREYLIPVVGKDFYSEIDAYVNGSESGSGNGADWEELLTYVFPVLTNLAFWLYVPIGNVRVSENGFTVISTDKVAPASQFRIQQLEDSLRETGFNAIDHLLEYLEAHKDDYDTWANSDQYTVFKNRLIKTAKEFSGFYHINNSRRLWLKLQGLIDEAESGTMTEILGKDLLEKLLEDGLDETYKEVKKLACRCLAYLVMADAIPLLGVVIDEQGVSMNDFGNSNATNYQGKVPASDNRLTATLEHAKSKAQQHLKKLQQYLEKNADSLAEYDKKDIASYTVNNDKNTSKVYGAF